jgi:hypothetical protein
VSVVRVLQAVATWILNLGETVKVGLIL